MGGGLVETVHSRRWSRSLDRSLVQSRRWGRSLDNFNRIVVLASPVGTALVALLLQHLLSLGIRKAQHQLHFAVLDNIVKLVQDSFSNLTRLEAADKDQTKGQSN